MSDDKSFKHEEKVNGNFSIDMMAETIENSMFGKMQNKRSDIRFAECNTDFDFDGYRNSLDAEEQRIRREIHRLEQQRTLIRGWWKSLGYYRDALAQSYEEIDKREKTIDKLRHQLEEKNNEYGVLSGTAKNLLDAATDARNQIKELEMKLAEMSKLSAGMAKKASEEAMLKALRTYAKTSKRKSADKRAFAKQAILELANVNGLTLPEDLAATIDSLDDEQTDPKVVNVSGNYNDIHDNSTVNQK